MFNAGSIGKCGVYIPEANICWTVPRAANKGVDLTVEENCTRLKDLGMPAKGCKGTGVSNNFWAHAVEICGGTDNMPNKDEIVKLVEYLYHYSGNVQEGVWMNVGSNIDFNALEKYSLKPVWGNNNYLGLWAGDIDTNNNIGAWSLSLSLDSVRYALTGYGFNYLYALCKGDTD